MTTFTRDQVWHTIIGAVACGLPVPHRLSFQDEDTATPIVSLGFGDYRQPHTQAGADAVEWALWLGVDGGSGPTWWADSRGWSWQISYVKPEPVPAYVAGQPIGARHG